MKHKLLLTLISIFVVTGLILSACAPSAEPTQAPAEEAAPVEEAAPAGEEVTVRVWTHQNDAFNEGLENLAKAYMTENPNVTINFETFDRNSISSMGQRWLTLKSRPTLD